MKYFQRALGLLASCLAVSVHASETPAMSKGEYLTRAADCVACHVVPGGKPFAGGLEFKLPFGSLYSPNITPDKETGIGNWTDDEFVDALQKGVGKDGKHYYPAFPYTSYTLMSREDILAIKGYLFSLEPVRQAPPENKLSFPFNQRWGMMFWNMIFASNERFVPDPKQSAEWNRGRYLAEGAAHCSTCHTPRGALMQEQKSRHLSGGQVGAWYAPDITNDKVHGIGSWSQEDLVTYLKTGRLDHRAQAAGSMAEAISYSFQHLTEADLNAIATYVRSVPSSDPTAVSSMTRFDRGEADNNLSGFRGKGFAAGIKGDHSGAQIFTANCASCHGFNAQGTTDGYYPSLFHNAATAGDNSVNLISAILNGVDRHTQDGHVFMPPFGDEANAVVSLDNVQVASLANYILRDYGNIKLTVNPEDVQVVRDGGPRSNIVTLARIGIAAGAVVLVAVLLLVGLLVRGRRKVADLKST